MTPCDPESGSQLLKMTRVS
uniref:Uncharacterized protein n=1 Tax=Rhizophora mucronata TaxID=61149 RepID=A0A2P2QL42_RHIMU